MKKSNRKRSLFRRSAAGAVALAGLAACVEPAGGSLDTGDAGPKSGGQVAVHTDAIGLPPLIADVTLSLGTLEATSDREPSAAARITMPAPLSLDAPAPTSIMEAAPATYGGVRFVAIDALTITTTTGRTIRIPFETSAPIALRCEGPGTYLPVGGEIDLFVSLDFADLQSSLTFNHIYPPLIPLTTVTDPTIVASLLDDLTEGLALDCEP